MQEAGLTGRFATYQPTFHLDEFAPGHWWVRDGSTQVGLVVRAMDFAELVNHDPFQPRCALAFPRFYLAPTQPSDRITLAKWINAQHTTSDYNELTFEVRPDAVTALFTERWENGRTASQRVTWEVDVDFGYVLRVESKMSSPQPESHEYCNFLPRGATDDRPDHSRYGYILWRHPSGRLVYQNLNNIGAESLGACDIHDRRRIDERGLLGFFGEPEHNPVIEWNSSSLGSTVQTCPNMLDQHLLWVPGDAQRADDKGLFVSRAAFRLASMPGEVAARLKTQSEPSIWLSITRTRD